MTPSDFQTETPRWSDLWAPERRAATATVALGVVLFAFNAFVVGTALPRAVASFGGTRWLAWATSLYLICAIVTGPAAAQVMARIGARRMFMASGVVFLAGTVLAAAAPDMGWLLVGRAMQGAGAGFIESGCYVLIPRLFPARLIPLVFGVEAVAWAVAAFAAPALAGLLAEAFSWRVALLSAVPMALVFLALVPRVVDDRLPLASGGPPVPLPLPLPLMSLLGVAGGMALIMASDNTGPLVGRLAVLLAGLGLFVAVIRADGGRLLPRGAFAWRGGAVGLGLWLALLMPLSQAAESVFLIYGLQVLWGWSAVQAGLAATVLALSWSGCQMLSARVAGDRRWLITAGAGLLVVAQAVMLAAFGMGSAVLMLAAQLAMGAAFGLSWGAVSQVVMQGAGDERDRAAGLLPVVMSAGYGIGAALFGLLANGMGFAGATGAELQAVIMGLFAVALGLAIAAFALAWALGREAR